ncbi:unnamed protein product [Peronospora belbahrii]|uniref:Mid2 domain-containing protein n=1 Tax=Peronospora belbahrii TaxID=622444 RepID=A0AAU9KZM6_9STRA|nr:unnamed protein product [Peronospora belbahrii]
MTIEQEAKALRILRQTQEVTNGNTTTASDAPTTVNMSVLSNATNYVDSNSIGHVKVNNDMGWSNILPNDSTVHIIYKESGPSGEILIIPAGQNASDATNSSFSGSDWMSGSDSTNPVNTLPTESSDDNVSRESKGLIRTGSSSVILVVVGTALALVAIVSVLAVVVYSRRNRRRAYSEDQSNSDQPFIVGSLPHQPVPQLSLLDTDMSPNLWLEGQYQYSPNMSGIRNSLNGTAILLDNSTAAMHHRYTVDARPSSRRGHRRNDGQGDVELDQRGNTGRNHAGYGNTVREDSGRDGSVRGNSVRDGSVRGGSAAWK